MGLQVYDSLKSSGKVPPEKMAVFDNEEGADQLSYMRYLPVTARPATAIYIVDNNLDGVVSPSLNHFSDCACDIFATSCCPEVLRMTSDQQLCVSLMAGSDILGMLKLLWFETCLMWLHVLGHEAWWYGFKVSILHSLLPGIYSTGESCQGAGTKTGRQGRLHAFARGLYGLQILQRCKKAFQQSLLSMILTVISYLICLVR